MSMRGRKVLVAGAAGLIGSNLIVRLLADGAQVRATLHRRDPVVVDPRIEYVRCDLTQGADCRRSVEGMEIVFLCAASTSGAAAIQATPMVHVTPNLLINSQMLEAAYEAKVRKFLFLSSAGAYPVSDAPMREEQMFDGEPFEKYYFSGWAKRFGEILCRMYGEKLSPGMTTIVLRPTNVYGPNDDFELATSHVLPALVRKSVDRWNPFEVWGDGSEVRDLIHVDDMVEAMVLAVERLESYATLNIGLGKGYSVKEVLDLVLELDGFTDARIVYNRKMPTMIPLRLVDISRAQAMLGFQPRVSLREGLRRTIDWYRVASGRPRP